MKSSKGLVFLSVIAIILVAGCTGGTTTSSVQFSQTAGAVIDDFSFDQKEIFEGDITQLMLRIQNVGAKNITDNSMVWIYGPVMSESGDGWKVSDTDKLKVTLETTGFLPPDVERRMSGSLDIETLDLTAPLLGLAPGMSRDQKFFARICYPYSTTAFSSITGISKNELKISNPTPSDAITRATAGPIQLKLISGDTVIAGRDLMIVFEVTNVGGGFSTTQATKCTDQKPDVSSADIDKVKVTVNVNGNAIEDCKDKDISIRNGKGTIACKYATSSSDPTTEHLITATATYNYFVTKETSITVKSDQ